MNKTPVHNKKYMSIAGTEACSHLSFAKHLWFLTGTGSRKAATAYISVRYQPFYDEETKIVNIGLLCFDFE
jgi:hypothetical protein